MYNELYKDWRNLLKECLLDPKDRKEDNALNVFKILYTSTKNISPVYSIMCAKEAVILACREKKEGDILKEFNMNILIFKTNTVQFVQEQMGNPVPK